MWPFTRAKADVVTPKFVPVLLAGPNLEEKKMCSVIHFLSASFLVTLGDIRAHTPDSVVQRASINHVGMHIPDLAPSWEIRLLAVTPTSSVAFSTVSSYNHCPLPCPEGEW